MQNYSRNCDCLSHNSRKFTYLPKLLSTGYMCNCSKRKFALLCLLIFSSHKSKL